MSRSGHVTFTQNFLICKYTLKKLGQGHIYIYIRSHNLTLTFEWPWEWHLLPCTEFVDGMCASNINIRNYSFLAILTLMCYLNLHSWPRIISNVLCLKYGSKLSTMRDKWKKVKFRLRSVWPWKLGHRSPISELARDISKMHLHTKFQGFPSLSSKVRAMTEG